MQRLGLLVTDDLNYHHSVDEDPASGSLHCHAQHELYFFISGSGEYYVEGNRFLLQPYTLIVMRPFEFHYFCLTGEVPYERYSLHFSDSLVPEADRSLLLGPTYNRRAGQENIYPAGERPELMAAFNRLDKACLLPDDEKRLMSQAILTEILTLILGYARRPLPQQGENLITRTVIGEVIEWLNEHLCEPVVLDDLAQKFYINKFHLCHQFKQATGTSVLAYVQQKRVLLAQSLLDKGNPLAQAARQAGFSDYSAFYRAYRRFMGGSPSGRSGRKPGLEPAILPDD